MNQPMNVGVAVGGEKIFFESLIFRGDQLRNEAWAEQQQSLAGFKPKKHGFFDFFLYEEGKEGMRILKWWCFKIRKTDFELAPYRRIEEERKKKKAEQEEKIREDERVKKDLEIENMRKSKQHFSKKK